MKHCSIQHFASHLNQVHGVLIVLLMTLLFLTCEFPYHPVPEPSLATNTEVRADSKIRVFKVNGSEQICNPSISQDTVDFAGCMLWLNFIGELSVYYSSDFEDYAGFSEQHDRLTIVDTTDSVRWFIKRDELGVSEQYEFQDPEWSSHPEYIISLLGASNRKDLWSCYVFHPKSGKKIIISRGGLFYRSTPHLWVKSDVSVGGEPEQITYDADSMADSVSIHTFFGTSQVKLVASKIVDKVLSLYYRDFSDDDGRFIPLKRPIGRDDWDCESPLISPDGRWITYNVLKANTYETYIQELSPESAPILFKVGASDPHWWLHPLDTSLLYLVYQEVPGKNLVEGDLSDSTYLATGSLGKTYRQLIRLFPGVSTGSVALARIGEPELLVNLPTKGGLSPDGKYLCTGYDRAFLLGLP